MMRITVNEEAIRRLQKDGEYRFPGLTREQSEKAATELAKMPCLIRLPREP